MTLKKCPPVPEASLCLPYLPPALAGMRIAASTLHPPLPSGGHPPDAPFWGLRARPRQGRALLKHPFSYAEPRTAAPGRRPLAVAALNPIPTPGTRIRCVLIKRFSQKSEV